MLPDMVGRIGNALGHGYLGIAPDDVGQDGTGNAAIAAAWHNKPNGCPSYLSLHSRFTRCAS
eukprot:scaffold263372_cov23-Tisochrysis_lutea.AAC.2